MCRARRVANRLGRVISKFRLVWNPAVDNQIGVDTQYAFVLYEREGLRADRSLKREVAISLRNFTGWKIASHFGQVVPREIQA